jgi:hypothetical protein
VKETDVITKSFKQTKLKIAFTANNSIKKYSEIKIISINLKKTCTYMLTDKLIPNAKKYGMLNKRKEILYQV